MHKNEISVQIISRYVDITYVRCHKKQSRFVEAIDAQTTMFQLEQLR